MSKLQLCNMYTSIAIGVAWDIQRLLGLTILLMIFFFFNAKEPALDYSKPKRNMIHPPPCLQNNSK